MKYLTLIGLALAATTARADFWDNCTAYGGTIITANSYGNDKGGLCNDPNDTTKTNNCNGKRFCASTRPMNWWSAFTWCESIGGQLASIESMCPGTQSAVPNTCPNVKGISSHRGCSSSGLGTDWLLNVDFSSGSLQNNSGGKSFRNQTSFNPICEE